MSLELKINEAIKEAMKAKAEGELRGLRSIKSAILLAKTAEGAKELNESDEIQLVTKLLKQRKDSLLIYEQQNRPDLALKEQEEINLFEKFLPQQLNEQELITHLKLIIEQVGASSAKDMGKVMAIASKQLAGKADGRLISETVKKMLN